MNNEKIMNVAHPPVNLQLKLFQFANSTHNSLKGEIPPHLAQYQKRNIKFSYAVVNCQFIYEGPRNKILAFVINDGVTNFLNQPSLNVILHPWTR